MAEVVFRIVLHEEVCIGLIRIHIKGLIGCHNDPCIFDRVTPSRSSSIRAKESLHSAESLGTELITVTNKGGTSQMSGISNFFQEVDGDKGPFFNPKHVYLDGHRSTNSVPPDQGK